MAIFHPVRPGNRGGRDLFKWDDVKEDKYRENYLGHSLNAPVGRWQRGKDLQWYTKKSKHDLKEQSTLEVMAIKQKEEDLMAELLGEKPKRAPPPSRALERAELNALFSKIADDEEEARGHRIQGVGYAPVVVDGEHGFGGVIGHAIMEGKGYDQPAMDVLAGEGSNNDFTHSNSSGFHDDKNSTLTEKELKRLKKKEKKEKKKEKKEKKKKEKKRKEKSHKDDDASSDSSGDYKRKRSHEDSHHTNHASKKSRDHRD